MVRLITKANGVSALLFHVEHSAGQRWQWRWRIRGRYPAAYLHWREGGCGDARQVIQPEVAGCEIEAQWRLAPDQRWQVAALREVAVGTASFRIKALEDLDFPEGFRAIAGLSGDLVAAWWFPPLVLHAGIETVIHGRADGPVPDSVLLVAGEFRPVSPRMELDNLTHSVGSLVAAVELGGRLSAIPGAAERRLFAVSRSPFVAAAEESRDPDPDPFSISNLQSLISSHG